MYIRIHLGDTSRSIILSNSESVSSSYWKVPNFSPKWLCLFLFPTSLDKKIPLSHILNKTDGVAQFLSPFPGIYLPVSVPYCLS